MIDNLRGRERALIVAENLKELRKSKGLTQDSFSKAMGIKRSIYGAYEEGRATPSLFLAEKITRFYGEKIERLLEMPKPKISNIDALRQLQDMKNLIELKIAYHLEKYGQNPKRNENI